MDLKEFITGYKGKDMPKELQDFNWGAFLLTFIWGIKFKAWITLLAIPLIWIQMPLGLNWVLLLILQFYCGFCGNKWAYQTEYWKKPADFRKTQIQWAVAAVLVHILVPFMLLSLIIRFIKKSPNNPMELAQNAQCSISYRELTKTMPRITYAASATGSEIAKKFASRYPDSTVENEIVTLKLKNGLDFNIIFTKHNETACNLKDKNCQIQASYYIPTGSMAFRQCHYYIDDRKNIVPDEQTKKSLEKGLNIFKYL